MIDLAVASVTELRNMSTNVNKFLNELKNVDSRSLAIEQSKVQVLYEIAIQLAELNKNLSEKKASSEK